MARMGSVLLADDMGLGKSLQALTVAAVDCEKGRGAYFHILIVAPVTLKGNWVEEIEKFTHFSYLVLEGTPAQRKAQLDEFDADILIVNYEQLKPHLAALNAFGFDVAIFDEAHYIKNYKSKRTKAAHALNAKRFLLLTGSPLLNQVNDLWSPLHMIDPGEYPRYWSFVSRYAVFGGFRDQEIVGVKNQAELTGSLKQVMIRRAKADVLDLPDKQYIQVWIDLIHEQRALYKQAVEEMKIDLPDDPNGMELENALTRMLRLKQICGTTATVLGQDHDHSAKLDRVEELVAEIIGSGERAVVFTQFRGVLAALTRRLEEDGIKIYTLHGDVPPADRVGVVNDWAADEPSVLLAMIQVAGVGLNMTAARKCIFVDKLFVPKLNEQAEDRLHRIGADTKQPIQIFELLCRNTIEQRVESILARKRKVFGEIVETSAWKRKLYKEIMEEEL
jgi:SNF2 family DNA or RNA helicase